jgi:hypothetical protein
MSSPYIDVKTIEFYRYQSTFCEAKISYAPEWKKKYIALSKESDYTDKTGEPKHSKSYVLYTLPAAKNLLHVLGRLIEDAERLSGV